MSDISTNPNIDHGFSYALLLNKSKSQELRVEIANQYFDTMEALKHYQE